MASIKMTLSRTAFILARCALASCWIAVLLLAGSYQELHVTAHAHPSSEVSKHALGHEACPASSSQAKARKLRQKNAQDERQQEGCPFCLKGYSPLFLVDATADDADGPAVAVPRKLADRLPAAISRRLGAPRPPPNTVVAL